MTSELFLNNDNGTIVNVGSEVVAINTVNMYSADVPSPGFDAGSFYFNGASSILSLDVNGTSLHNFGTGEFTIDFWMRSADVTGFKALLTTNDPDGAQSPTPILLAISSGYIYCWASSGSGAYDVLNSVNVLGAVVANTWYHIAITSKNGNLYFFKDGVLTHTVVGKSIWSGFPGATINFGSRAYGGLRDLYFRGDMSYIRIDSNEGFWDSNFNLDEAGLLYTPPDTDGPVITLNGQANILTGHNLLNLAGTATDDSTITGVTWINSKGGSGAGVGTDTWTISDVSLVEGVNVITITISDELGNATNKIVTAVLEPNRHKTNVIYNMGRRGNLRGKAKDFFVRPTLKQFFTSTPNWKAVDSRVWSNDSFDPEVLDTSRWDDQGSVFATFNTGRVGNTLGPNSSTSLLHLGEISGDFDVKVHLDMVVATGGYYSGIVFNDGSNDKLALFRNNNGLWRNINGTIAHGGTTTGDIWLRIRRVGSTGYCYFSTNGTSWTSYGSGALTTANGNIALRMGVNVTSGTLATWFDDFTFTVATFVNKFRLGQ